MKKNFKFQICSFKNSRIFQEYSRNISQKTVTKVIKKQTSAAHAIMFAPRYI